MSAPPHTFSPRWQFPRATPLSSPAVLSELSSSLWHILVWLPYLAPQVAAESSALVMAVAVPSFCFYYVLVLVIVSLQHAVCHHLVCMRDYVFQLFEFIR